MQSLSRGSSWLRRHRRSRGRARGFCPGGGGGLLGVFGGFGEGAEVLAGEFGVLDINRTRMGLLFLDANLGEILDQDLGLDLEFPGQFIYANLVGL